MIPLNSHRWSKEARRIYQLPLRDWQSYDLDKIVDVLSRYCTTPEGYAAGQRLFPAQAVALMELADLGRLICPLDVGLGKTAIWMLAPWVLKLLPSEVLVLMPASLIKPKEAEIREWRERGWRVVQPLMCSYEKLSCDENALADFGDQVKFLALDESLCVKGFNTRRYKHLKPYVESRLASGKLKWYVPLDGTWNDPRQMHATNYHLIWAMGKDHSPFPTGNKEARKWSKVLSVSKNEVEEKSGPLAEIISNIHPDGDFAPAAAFGRRFRETPGVVASARVFEGPLHVRNVVPPLNRELVDGTIAKLVQENELPGGIICATAFEKWRQVRAIVQGWYDVYDPPPPTDWLIARREWAGVSRALSEALGLAKERDIARWVDESGEPDQQGALGAWRDVRDEYKLCTKPIWLHKDMVVYAAEWLDARPHGVVWSDRRPFCRALTELSGVPWFAAEGKNDDGIAIDDWIGPAICSVRSCGRGHQIQHHHHEALVVSMYERGDHAQQLIGRHHRTGQRKPVTVSIVTGHAEQLSGLHWALEDARLLQQVTGTKQKLISATTVEIDERWKHEND